MVIEGEARRAYRLQHRVAQPLAIIELVRVGGLEQETAQVDELQQQAVARRDRMIVDMPRIRQVMPDWSLPCDRSGISGQGR